MKLAKRENITMTFESPQKVQLYVRSMGKLLKITAAFTDIDFANCYMETHPDDGVVAEIGNTILLANRYDRGMVIKP